MTMKPGCGLHPQSSLEMDPNAPCPMSYVPWLWYIELYYRGIQRKANRHGMNNNKVSSHDKHPLVCPLVPRWWRCRAAVMVSHRVPLYTHTASISSPLMAAVSGLCQVSAFGKVYILLLLLGVTWHLWVHLKFLVFGLVDAFYWPLISLQLWHNIVMYP